jgi:pentatricopeptide repeat protein
LSDVFLLAWAKSKASVAVDRALSLLNTMAQQGTQPNVHTYNSVIDCMARRGENPKQVEAIVDRIIEADLEPNVVTYSAVINGTFGCPSMMLRGEPVPTHQPDVLLLLSAWAKSEAPDAVDRAFSILNTMEQKGLDPNVQTYNSVIDCIAQHGDNPEQAEAIIDRMTKAGVHPDVVTYNALTNGMIVCLV